MSRATDGPKPVAGWVRVLAWVIVISSCVAAIGAASQLWHRGIFAVPWLRVAPFMLLVAWMMPLFWIVAATGRPPRRWWGLGTRLWQSDAEQRRERL